MIPTTAGVPVNRATLRRMRQLAGYTGTALAARASVSKNYLSQIETGARRTVSPPTFVALCDALGIAKDERHVLLLEEQDKTELEGQDQLEDEGEFAAGAR